MCENKLVPIITLLRVQSLAVLLRALLRDVYDIPKDPDSIPGLSSVMDRLSSDWLAGRLGANIQLLVKS